MAKNVKSRSKKFWLIDNIDKLEIIYKILIKIENGTTAYQIARIAGCNPDTARTHLKTLRNFDLAKVHIVGRYRIFIPVKTNNKHLREYLEKKLQKIE